MIQFEILYKKTAIELYRHLIVSSDWMLQSVLCHKNKKKLVCVSKEAQIFSRKLDLNLGNDDEIDAKATVSEKKKKKKLARASVQIKSKTKKKKKKLTES